MAGAAKRLGELLIAKKLITQAQLDLALAEQKTSREFLGSLLMRKGWIKEEALFDALAEQFGMSFVRLDESAVDWTIAKRFASPSLVEHNCLVIQMDNQSITVAVSNPLDPWGVSELERVIGFRKLQLVLALPKAIREANQRCLKEAVRSINTMLGGSGNAAAG